MSQTRPGDISRRTALRLGTAGGATLGLRTLGAGTLGAGLGAGLAAVGHAGLAFGAPTAADTLVVVSLRGGLDGLSMIPPIGDPAYPRARPTLAVPASAAHHIDATFGLHPALAPVLPLWEAGKLAAVHAVGQLAPTRSHVDAVAAMERAAPAGDPAPAGGTGWIGRAVGLMTGAGAYAATQVGEPGAPASLAGPHPAYTMGSLDAVSIAMSNSIVPVRGWQDALTMLHGAAAGHGIEPIVPALAAAAQLDTLPPVVSAAESGYPVTPLGQALHDVARLVKAGLGLRVATVEDTGWDLHAGMGRPEQGPMADKLGQLAKALAAFAAELGPDLGRVVLVTLSEFGRRVAENGSGGTDHGRGGALLVLGGAVTGRAVHGTWPGLEPRALDDGDLAVATDYRQVLAEILSRRCGVTATTSVFPGLTPSPPGVVRAR